MIDLKKGLAVAAVAMAATSAMALPQFQAGTNEINFIAYENQYRTDAACAVFGGCLAGNAAIDPPGFKRVDPTITGLTAIIPTDVFIGIFRVTVVSPSNWTPAGTDTFTGYTVQEVDTIVPSVGTQVQINMKAAASDPFNTGKLGPGAVFSLYTGSTFNQNGLSALATINSATNGTHWADLGLTGNDTYFYTLDDTAVSGADSINTGQATKSFMGLDLLATGPSYNLRPLNKVNDLSENLVGGVTASGDLLCSAADIASATVKCSDFVGNADVKRSTLFYPNPAVPQANRSPWYYQVNDPISFNMVPEPGTLALVGLALAGIGAMRRRTSK